MNDALGTVAAGAAAFTIVMMILSIALMLYFIVMPFLIYLRLGRIARVLESSNYDQKLLIVELKEFAAVQRKIDSNASVQTTILKNLDQNLALGINKALPSNRQV